MTFIVIWLRFTVVSHFFFLFCFFSFFILFIRYNINRMATATTDERIENKHWEKKRKKKIVVNWISLKVCQNYVELISHSNVLHHWIKSRLASHSFFFTLLLLLLFLAWFYFFSWFFLERKLILWRNELGEWFVSILVGLGLLDGWRWLDCVMKCLYLNFFGCFAILVLKLKVEISFYGGVVVRGHTKVIQIDI